MAEQQPVHGGLLIASCDDALDVAWRPSEVGQERRWRVSQLASHNSAPSSPRLEAPVMDYL